ncbi:MAG TPA: GNAT family N-acetyltransferase [Bacteroidales bacterium]|nr:GNAT family N-acetyltransferase [Bacteroidales bacterium]HPS15793.1 GNAT family N-acetyltransferase [Bacteroidales bacterium]
MITELKEEEIALVLQMSDKFVGKNFQTYESIKDYILNPQKVIRIYKINNEIVGFVKGEILKKSEFKKSLLKVDKPFEKKVTDDGYMGYAETICVKEEYRHTHIAHDMADELIRVMKKIENIDVICTTVWKSGDIANAKNLVETIGFKLITEIKNYWYNDSIKKKYMCPHCGNPPCKCSMLFYKM